MNFSGKTITNWYSYDVQYEKEDSKPDVLIDFSLPEAFEQSIIIAKRFEAPFIIGTTGLTENHIKELKNLSMKFPVIQSFNYSIGIQMLIKASELLNQYLSDWDIEISETHHRYKKDKPSGTAKMLEGVFNKETPVSSHRLGHVAGDHTVYFGGSGELISLTHRALSRRTFAEGVLKSAEFAVKKSNGLYSFKDVLFSN